MREHKLDSSGIILGGNKFPTTQNIYKMWPIRFIAGSVLSSKFMEPSEVLAEQLLRDAAIPPA
jgi:hypothetical protein